MVSASPDLFDSWQQYHHPDDVAKSLEESFQRLKLDYGTDYETVLLQVPSLSVYLSVSS